MTRHREAPAAPDDLSDRPSAGLLTRALDHLGRDLRQALRSLVRERAFTATTVATVALCIGVTLATWGVFQSVVLEPLPVEESERIVTLYNSYPGAGVPRSGAAVPDYFDRREQTDAFESLAMIDSGSATLGLESGAERIESSQVTATYFELLRVGAHRGRLFTEEDEQVGAQPTVVVSHGLWRRLWAGDEAVFGRERLVLDGVPHTVIGSLPPGFRFAGDDAEVWTPAIFTPEDRADDNRHSNSWQMLGRLADGVSLEQARAQIDALNARNMERFPEFRQLLVDVGFSTPVENLQEEMIRDIRPTLGFLLGGALFVLLIGCVNLANLVFVRATGQLKDLATRSALGAGRGRLIARRVVESLVLAFAGAGLGLALAVAALELLAHRGLEHIPRGSEIGLDAGAVVVAAGLAVGIGLVLGLVPALQVLGSNLAQLIRQESRTGSASRRSTLARQLLVTTQVAIACVLLVGAGFLLVSFAQTLAVDPGFDGEDVLSASFALPDSRYEDMAARRGLADRLVERARALPGVETVALAETVPFSGASSASVIAPEGYEMAPGESVIAPLRVPAGPGLFEALDVPVLEGRTFEAGDVEDARRVMVIDAWLARHFWGDESPIGDRMTTSLADDDDPVLWTVVGVVGEMTYDDLVDRQFQGAYYFPTGQMGWSRMHLVLETSTDPASLVDPVRSLMAELDPETPLFDARVLADRVDDSLAQRRLPLLIALVFAVTALFLAAVGIYGVLAYSVAQRSRELAVRLALGSAPARLFGLVLSQGARVLAVGLVVGLAGAFFLTRAMGGMLYGVDPGDPRLFAGVAALLAAVVLTASAVPALRATRVDPASVLDSQ